MKTLAKGKLITIGFYVAIAILAFFVIRHLIEINKTIEATK